METALVVGLLVVTLACVGLLVARGKLQADAAGAAARATAAESERERLNSDLAQAQTKIDELGGRAQSLSGKVLLLEQEADTTAQRHQSDLKQAQRILD